MARIGSLMRKRRTRKVSSSSGNVKGKGSGYDSLTPPAPRDRLIVFSADGTQLNVEIFGKPDAPTIVLAHGWTCSIVFWARQLNALAPNYRVVAYDQRGHGESGGAGPAGFTTAALADDLAAVLQATVPAGQKAILVGHSMGSMASISLAGRHPSVIRDKVAAAVLTSTGMSQLMSRSAIVPMPLPLATVFAPISAKVIGMTPPGKNVNRSLKFMIRYASLSRSATPAEVDFSARIVSACNPATRSGFANMLASMNLDDLVQTLDVPTIVVTGVRDRLTPIWHSRRLAENLPQLVELVEIEDAGHMTPVQSGDRVNAAILQLAEMTGLTEPTTVTGSQRKTIDLTPSAETSSRDGNSILDGAAAADRGIA